MPHDYAPPLSYIEVEKIFSRTHVAKIAAQKFTDLLKPLKTNNKTLFEKYGGV